MALAIVVTLEKDLADAAAAYAKAKAGKALARESDRLDNAAKSRGFAQLTAMLSENPEKLAAQLREDGFDPTKMRLPPEQWYPATDGLKTVRTLAEHVRANLNNYKQPNPILRDLLAVDAFLAAAENAGVRFHFSKVDL